MRACSPTFIDTADSSDAKRPRPDTTGESFVVARGLSQLVRTPLYRRTEGYDTAAGGTNEIPQFTIERAVLVAKN